MKVLWVSLAVSALAQQNGQPRQFELKAETPAMWELIAKDAKLEKVAGGFGFTEGPVWDERGFLYVSDEEKNAVSRLYPDGRIEASVRMPQHDPLVTNICFGGADMRTAYVTSSGLGKLYEIEWPWKGLRLHFQR